MGLTDLGRTTSCAGAHLHADGVALVSQQGSSGAHLYVEVGGVWSEAEVPTDTGTYTGTRTAVGGSHRGQVCEDPERSFT